MREILFRGKTPDGQWVFGDLIKDPCEIDGGKYIEYMIRHYDEFTIDGNEIFEFVMAKTVGQYTGLKDKNGKNIFEGDVLSHPMFSSKPVVSFVDGSFILIGENDLHMRTGFHRGEVTGNIHDNPELLR